MSTDIQLREIYNNSLDRDLIDFETWKANQQPMKQPSAKENVDVKFIQCMTIMIGQHHYNLRVESNSREEFLNKTYQEIQNLPMVDLPEYYNVRAAAVKHTPLLQCIQSHLYLKNFDYFPLLLEPINVNDIPFAYKLLVKKKRENPSGYLRLNKSEAIILPTSRIMDPQFQLTLNQDILKNSAAETSLRIFFHRSCVDKVDIESGRVVLGVVVGRPHREFLITNTSQKDDKNLFQTPMTFSDDHLSFKIERALAPPQTPTLVVFISDERTFHQYGIFNVDKF